MAGWVRACSPHVTELRSNCNTSCLGTEEPAERRRRVASPGKSRTGFQRRNRISVGKGGERLSKLKGHRVGKKKEKANYKAYETFKDDKYFGMLKIEDDKYFGMLRGCVTETWER